LAFAEAGADIAICDYANENNEFEKLTEEIKAMGRKCFTLQTDVSKSEQVIEMVKKVKEAYGRIDILVNNAGISPGTPPIPDLSEPDWDAVININLKGTYLCIREVSKSMIAQQSGNIINIASVEGLATVRHASSPYGASKAGIINLTKGLAWDMGKHNIRVNAIAPGFIRTDMTRYLQDNGVPSAHNLVSLVLNQAGVDPDSIDSRTWENTMMQQFIPAGRSADPREIATGALYLASDAASYVSGHTLVIDGGSLA